MEVGLKSELRPKSTTPCTEMKHDIYQPLSSSVGVSASPCYKPALSSNIGNWGLSPISSPVVTSHTRSESMYPALYSASSPGDYFYVSTPHVEPAYRGELLSDWQQYCQLYYPSSCNLLSIRPNIAHNVSSVNSSCNTTITNHTSCNKPSTPFNPVAMVTSTSGDPPKPRFNKDIFNSVAPITNAQTTETDLLNSLSLGGSDSMNMIRCSTPEMMMALASLQDDKLKCGFTDKNDSGNVSMQSKYLKNDISLASAISHDSGFGGSSNVHLMNQMDECSDTVQSYVMNNNGVCNPTSVTPPKDFVAQGRVVFPTTIPNLVKCLPLQMKNSTSVIDPSANEIKKPTGIAKVLPHLQSFNVSMSPGYSPANNKRKVSSMEPPSVDDESAPKRYRHNQPLNSRATQIMTEWYEKNREHPYPSKIEKEWMSREGGISQAQLKSWFANKRNRSNNTRPKVQKRAMSEKLLNICHQLARDAQKPVKDNAFIIQQLSSIISSGE